VDQDKCHILDPESAFLFKSAFLLRIL
jgi:hypothetical protein